MTLPKGWEKITVALGPNGDYRVAFGPDVNENHAERAMLAIRDVLILHGEPDSIHTAATVTP